MAQPSCFFCQTLIFKKIGACQHFKPGQICPKLVRTEEEIY
ncbi:uncharacterized protein TOL2_C14050 [Desulfobacula toluolica Tol2]|uniref:Uncharacterized protein n=1 Tax=Desulfobacula toluolica (strain DSM 7467 / Tol2) TaxID=651182 RepID=K0NIH5_DESTT|nr:uncharacterized protein TOL2_C14050 [Desulfobacula toluolica Tol2]